MVVEENIDEPDADNGHSNASAVADHKREKEMSRLENEYRNSLRTYSEELRLFETAWSKFEEDKRKWQLESATRANFLKQTEREVNDTFNRLRATLDAYQTKVRGRIPSLEDAYERFQKSSSAEIAEIKALETNKRESQLRQFLDSKLIRSSQIESIRHVDTQTLLAYASRLRWM